MAEDRFHTIPKVQPHGGGFQSLRRLRGSSPQWKEHYVKVSEKWGAIAAGSGQQFNHAWDDIRRQREKGGYPWTHLEHDKDGEVWLDPLSLPRDITGATLRRKDRSIPREWFHLPAGAVAPTVEQLLKDSSSEDDEAGPARAKSPPICGRSRSKSRERKPHKKSSLSQDRHAPGYEPINVSRRAISAAPVKPFQASNLESPGPPTPPPKPPRNLGQDTHDHRDTKQQPASSQLSSKTEKLKVPNKVNKQESDSDSDDNSLKKSCFPRSRSRSKSRDRGRAMKKEGELKKSLVDNKDFPYATVDKSPALKQKSPPPRLFLKDDSPPPVDRSSKPVVNTNGKQPQPQKKTSKQDKQVDDGGYEPVGAGRSQPTSKSGDPLQKTKIYEDIPDILPVVNGHSTKEVPAAKDWTTIPIKPEVEPVKLSKTHLAKGKDNKETDETIKNKNEEELKLKENQAKEEEERSKKEKKDKEEKERKTKEKLEKEQQEKEKKMKEKMEKEKKEKEEKDRKAKEKLDKEIKEQQEKERKAKEKAEKEQKEKEEKDKKLKEKADKERKEQEEKDKKMKEKADKERKEQEEKDKKQKEKADKERKEQEEKDKKMKEKADKDRKEQEEKDKKAKEKLDKEMEEKDRKAKEKLDRDQEESNKKAKEKQDKEMDEKDRKSKSNEEKKHIEEEESMLKDLAEMQREEEDRKQIESQNKDEKDRQNREERDRKIKLERENEERLLKEQMEEMKKESEEAERRLNKELALNAKEEKERKKKSKEEKERAEKEAKALKKKEKEEKEKEEKERKLKEKEEKERKEKEAKEKKLREKELTEREEREKKMREKEAKEQREKDEKERKMQEKIDKERRQMEKQQQEEERKALAKIKIETPEAELHLDKPKIIITDEMLQETLEFEEINVEEVPLIIEEAKSEESKVENEKQKKLKEKLLKEAEEREKAGLKAAKEAAKAERKAAQEAEKAAIEAEKAAKKAAQEAEKTALKAAQEAEKVALKAAQEAEKAEKKAIQEAEKKMIQENEIEAEKSNKAGKEKRSFFNFLKKKPKSKSLSDLNEFAPRPSENDPGTFEEIDFALVTLDSSKQEPNFSGDELYEPIGVQLNGQQSDLENPLILDEQHAVKIAIEGSVNQSQPSEVSTERPKDEHTHQRSRSSPPLQNEIDDFSRFAHGDDLQDNHLDDEDDLLHEAEPDHQFHHYNGFEDEDSKALEVKEVNPNIVKKERKPREPIRLPKVDLKAKLVAMNEKVKNARMPSPHEMKEGYLNSPFHKSFQQPLTVRSREMVDTKELEQRQLIKSKSPAELAQIHSLSDIPVPSSIKCIFSSPQRKKEAIKRRHSADQGATEGQKTSGVYGTLPRSIRDIKLVTNCRDMNDEEELKKRQELIQTKTPAELSRIGGFSDLPVPSKLEKIFKRPQSKSDTIKKEKRSRSESLPRSTGESKQGTLSKSWLQQSLITQVKVENDPEVLEKRRALTESKTPAELSQITSISDLPIPTALEKFLKKPKQDPGNTVEERPSSRLNNLESMYNTLPRALKTEVLVRTKVEENDEELKRRQELVEKKKPNELSQIQSLSDIPLPSSIQNIFKSKGDVVDDAEHKPRRNFNELFSANSFPESMRTEVLVRSKVEEDPEVLRQRQEVVKTKTPSELSQINSLDDFPLPQKIDTLIRSKKRNLKSTQEKENLTKDIKSKSWTSLASSSTLYDAIPDALKTEVLVRSRVESPELQKERSETIKSKTVMELSQIHSLSDIPLPKQIENLLHPDLRSERPSSEASSEPRSLKDNFYDTLPKSMKTDLLVRVREEDPEVLRQRRELTRAKSPTELSQITSMSDFPIPTTLENLMKRKSPEPPSDETPQPPQRTKKEMLYNQLPDSLKTEVLVRTKIETDETIAKERQELCRSKSPTELSEIHDLSEFPLPTFVEKLINQKSNKDKSDVDPEPSAEGTLSKKSLYEHLPDSLKAECLVRSKVEDPFKQRARADIIKAKSVHELSQISSLSEFPLPSPFENLIQRGPRPVERKKRFREKQRSLSAKSLRDKMYDTLPRSLKSEVLVRGKIEDPDVREERKKLVQSKSVNELSQINSLSDFPLPSTLERIIHPAKTDPSASGDEPPKCQSSGIPTPAQMKDNIYASLPRSLKSEVLVRTRVESPDVLRQRQLTTQSKSVSELSKLRSLSDLPIPTTIEKIIKQAKALKNSKQEPESIYGPATSAIESGSYDIYASLPRSLKSQVMVRSKVEENDDGVRKRQALVESKTPAELSQINSFSEIPLPKRIEEWLHHNEQQKQQDRSNAPLQSRSFHELRTTVYDTLPRSLKEPTLVRTKIEDPEVQRERSELTKNKTPSQLAEIHTIGDIPIPGLWERGREPSKKSRSAERSLSIPKNAQELRDKIIPESLLKPCVVRCKIEDPEVLVKHQLLQQSKSIHELSKIRNLNEFPLPINIKLPDVPLPSAKKMLKPKPRNDDTIRSGTNLKSEGEDGSSVSTPGTQDKTYSDDEMSRFDTASPESVIHREQDFGYEVIEQNLTSPANRQAQSGEEDEDEEENLAEQYKGTPPLKSKKKKISQQRNNHDHSDQVQVLEDTPPPLPPKRPPGSTSTKNNDDQASSCYEECDGESQSSRIQSRPLPPPPAPTRSLRRGAQRRTPSPTTAGFLMRSSSSHSQVEQFHSVASTLDRTLVDSSVDRRLVHHSEDNDDTLADSILESMQSCKDTLHGNDEDPDDPTLHSCADTLADSDDEFFSEQVEGAVGGVAELPRDDDDTPTVSQGKDDFSISARLRNDTQELSKELLQHVENLRNTLDKMSSRLGTSPEPH